MEPAVVVKVRHRAVEIASQRRAVIVSMSGPANVRHAQPVHQDDDVPPCVRKRLRKRSRHEIESAPIAPHGHGGGEWVVCGDEMVTNDAVQCGAGSNNPRSETLGHGAIVELPDGGVVCHRHPSSGTADASVDEPRDTPSRLQLRPPEHSWSPGDLVVHAFHHVSERVDRLEGDLPPPAQARDADGVRLVTISARE